MLILMRRPGERLLITTPSGEQIWVVVAEIQLMGRVRLGFIADKDVLIDREEVVLAKLREQAPRDGGCVESRGPLAEGR